MIGHLGAALPGAVTRRDLFVVGYAPRASREADVNGFDIAAMPFNETLMRGMLAFLLFAGALQVDLERPRTHAWMLAALAILDAVLSTVIVAALTWWVFQRTGIDIAFDVCLAFGALMAGESLCGAGLAAVVFFAIVPVIGLSADNVWDLAGHAALVVLVMGAGLWIRTRTHARIDAFSSMVAGILTAVLVLLLGLQMFVSGAGPATLARGLLAIPIVFLVRLVSAALPMRVTRPTRGGLSAAMMLSLPPFPERALLLASTFAVVVFSIAVRLKPDTPDHDRMTTTG